MMQPAPEFVVAFAAPDEERIGARLAARRAVSCIDHPQLQGEALIAAAAAADLLVVRASQRLDQRFFQRVRGRLRAILLAAAGVDNIDLAAAAAHGIEIVQVDPGNATAVAEWVMAHLSALIRPWRAHWQAVEWDWSVRESLRDGELRGRTLGVVGLGRCGSRVSLRARAFEMSVLAIDPYLPDASFDSVGAKRYQSIDLLLPQVDALTLHCPLSPETRGMIGIEQLRALPRGAVLLNAARGGIVDEDALLQALEEGVLAGAAIDVWEQEPRAKSGLAAHPKVLATPHLAGHTAESHRARAQNLERAIESWLDSHGVPTR